MSDSPLTSSRKYPELPSDLIDQVCDQFESAVRDGREPRIEDYLGIFPQLDRQALLQELIALEVELLGTWNDSATVYVGTRPFSFESYYKRFPEAAPALSRLQKEWEQRRSRLSGLESHSAGSSLQVNPIDGAIKASKRRINQFELQSVLGHGAFGIVWHARDKRLQRNVALKVRRPDRAGADKAMFLSEARAAARLHHPNIVAIHEVGELDSEIYIVSELVDGVSLKTWLQTQKMSPTDAAKLMAKLAAAVHHAHEAGIVHRDLKPANVLIDKKGEPHVADFGLAKRETVNDAVATPGQLIGTPAYMAPEQARGDHDAIDPRTDVYGLGAIFYELLTADRPFMGEMSVLLEHIQYSAPKAPRKIKPEIPAELEAICLKCLAKDPGHRYATAEALAEDLRLYLAGETLRGIPAALPNRAWKWFHRHRGFVTAIAATFLVALLGAGSLAWQFRGTKPIPIDRREVKFTTEPSGCEITVVKIDRESGEPDPTKIEHARGRTPLKMALEPGDYLVVGVLDDNRFNEVRRHVPSRQERVPKTPLGVAYGYWTADAMGVIQAPSFKIPEVEVTRSMGFVEPTAELIEPKLAKNEGPRTWKIPGFFVDPREILVADVEKRGIEKNGAAGWAKKKSRNTTWLGLGPGPYSCFPFPVAMQELENRGKRFPSAAELYYLSEVVCPKPPQSADAAPPKDICTLPDLTRIQGLHSGAWEWTTTKPGGPFSGTVSLESVDRKVTDFLIKMVGGGRKEMNNPEPQGTGFVSISGFHSAMEPNSSRVGVRGVRSLKPRRRPEDFVAPVVGSSRTIEK